MEMIFSFDLKHLNKIKLIFLRSDVTQSSIIFTLNNETSKGENKITTN